MTRQEAVGEADETRETRSLWFDRPGRCAIRLQHICPTGSRLVVRSLFSGISRGTEATVFAGKVPPGEHERMRAPYQEGSFGFPLKYGYSSVGVVERGPQALIGRTIFALHPHQDVFTLEPGDAHPLPEGVPAERAVLAANMETALNIVWDAQVSPGDRVVVFGAGVVGLLVAYLSSRIAGTDVTACDTNEERADPAGRLGVPFGPPQTLAGEYDCLINASGSPEALRQALRLGGMESRIVEASWYADRQIEIPLGEAFHARRLSIISSQVGSLPPHKRARWDHARRLRKALQLLADDRLDCLITGETPFAELAGRYGAILASPATLCHRISY